MATAKPSCYKSDCFRNKCGTWEDLGSGNDDGGKNSAHHSTEAPFRQIQVFGGSPQGSPMLSCRANVRVYR